MTRDETGRVRHAFAEQVLGDDRAAAGLPLEARLAAPEGIPTRFIGLTLPVLKDLQEWIDERLGTPQVSELTFTTLADGEPREVTTLVLQPPRDDAPAPTSTLLFLASSGARQGKLLVAEALAIYRHLDPPRRLVVVPLPAAEQRGPGWPALATADLTVLSAMGRQSALDVARAARACAAQSWPVDAVGGFSLGGIYMASIVGLRPDLFDGVELYLFGAGAGLETLATTSPHHLAQALAPQPGLPEVTRRRHVAAIEPLTHLSRARVSKVHMVLGTEDRVITPASAEALAAGFAATGAEVDVEWTNGGHGSVIGIPLTIERLFTW